MTSPTPGGYTGQKRKINMANENPKLTITLTGRAPVTVDKEQWPVIASAKDWDNQYEFQANRRWKLTVRQHEDGRAIVYGVYTTQYQNEDERRGGELLDTNRPGTGTEPDIPGAILRVAEYLNFDRRLADRCIADLPAVDI